MLRVMTAPDQPRALVRPLLQTRQVREFTDEPPTDDELEAITDVARWSGSSTNEQPWRFIVVRDPATIAALRGLAMPSTRALTTATAAVVVTVPAERERQVGRAYDEGRAAERMLIAAGLLGLGAGIVWLWPKVRETARTMLGVPEDRKVRTIIAIGHPTAAAALPKSAPGAARLPREQTVFEERWPAD
jgi:nitroreductase